ncbi:SNARE protein YKT6, synaptobrevin/VAMP syperfamily [Pseudoloma neurophilia]|uniref:SNARE protein YKT6, synaptobrevin/VAMP syperfamily n=1 Tax=Pseudoloma neurophilia TaxID=146866 RepID=A0A0R0LVT8_9MICR|nr:SNARE protein YKT6, synaptobrevin/VAMP syperfamily [Pseudoloma neurophilia]
MTLLALFVVDGDRLVIKNSAFDLSSYNFLIRSRIKDALKTFALQISSNIETTELQEIIHEMNDTIYKYFAKINTQNNQNIICLAVIQDYYPPDLMSYILDLISKDDIYENNSNLSNILQEYKDYKKHDYLELINNEIAETKIVLTRTLDAVINRGESLTGLSENAEKLEVESRRLFKTAKKQNKKCC